MHHSVVVVVAGCESRHCYYGMDYVVAESGDGGCCAGGAEDR